MKSFKFLLLTIGFLLFFVEDSKATHVAGGYVQFECTGTPGQYIVRLHLYRDCSGSTLWGNQTVRLSNTCGLGNINVNVAQVSSQEVSQICPQQINNTTCNGGNLPGYEEFIYEATVNIGDCDTWTASFSLCCRNTTNNLTGQQAIELTTQVNTATDNCNDSPTVTAQPEPFVCLNQPVSYNLGAFEPDGDSIVYSLVPASTNGNNSNYTNPFSGTNPMPGVTIDPTTGTVTYTPTTQGAWVFVIQMTEYDSNGNIVSVTNYEYQTYVEICNNDPPQPPSAIPGGGISNVSGSAVQNSASSLTLCQGFEGCFDVVFSDPDAGDILTVQSNLASVLPGATISQTGTNPLTVSVCWTPVTTSGTVTLSFLVEDDACPIVGQNNYAASINVVNPGIPSVSTTVEACGGTDEGTATITMAGGVAPFTYNITGPVNGSNGTGFFGQLPPGNYSYIVNTGGGCDVSGTFTIVPGPPMPITASSIDADCNGACDGSATATPGGGSAPYIYVWGQGGSSIGQNTQTASNLCAGTYDVTVTDNLGCQNTESVIVAEPTPLVGNIAPTDATCNGTCDGTVVVSGVSGGTTPYQYSLNNGANQAGTTFSGLCVGPQQVEITDGNNCTITLNTTVAEPTPVTVVLDATTPATCGSTNGTATVTGSGGTTPYQYSIGGPNQGSNVFNNLSAGSYTVTITDGNNCTATVPVTVSSVAQPTAFVDNQNDLLCFGGNNGSVIIGTTGAVAPMTYSLNGGAAQASNSFSGLAAGSYTVDVTDANGCVATVNFTITEPTVLTYTSTVTDASCNGVCDGEILINASGGTGPYQFSSNNGLSFSTNNPLTGLCAGNVNVVVQDASGCLSNSTVAVAEPAAITANYVNVDPLCEGACDGSIEVNVNGGSTPYNYSVNGGASQASNLLTGLCAGNQAVVVQDANGCELSSTQTLTDPPGIDINQVSMTPSNCGFNDGELEVQATGVNAPFQYSVNGGANQATGLFQNMLAGGYNVTVTDAIGCQESVFFGINDVQMNGQLVSQTDVSCFGGSDGTVEVINLAGSAPISFELDNSGVTQTNGTFTGLSAGSHIVTIYDAGFCIFTIPFTTNEPDEITFNTNIGDIACNGGATGSIEFTNVAGGVGGYQYSIDGGFAFQASNVFNGLTAGTYTLVIVDANGCPVMGSATVQEATPVSFTTNVFDLGCNSDNSGAIQVVASGGSGSYTYSNDNGLSFQANQAFSGLAAGSYDIVVEDAFGCDATQAILVTEPAPLTATVTPTDALCNGACDGEVDIVATGGTSPYIYSIDNGVTTTSNTNISGICASTFVVAVADQNACLFTINETIGEPTEVTFTSTETPATCGNANGQIDIVANGGTPTYVYSSDNGTSFNAGDNFSGLAAGTYNLVVQDQNSCPASGTQIVSNEASPQIDLVTGTDPLCNGDADGTIAVTASGGTGALSYSINGGAPQAANNFTNLTAGNYTITVEDVNGCTDTDNIILDEPALLTLTSAPTDLACFQNSTGSILVTPNGGTPAYQYSFDNGATFGSSPSNNFIDAGTYNIVLEDANGCQATGTETVNEPPLLDFNNITAVDATCNSYCDGSIELDVIGGTAPYSYNWVQNVAGVNDNLAQNLCTGNYDFIVTDGNGCQISDLAFIDQPDSVEITNIVSSNVVCNGDCDGSIEITAPTGVQFSIDNGATFQASNVFNNLCDGDYDIVVEDNIGCLVEDDANIWQPDPLTLQLTDDTTVCYGYNYQLVAIGEGGIQPYTYQWSQGTTTEDTLDIVADNTDTYTVDIVDDNGCTATQQSVTVTVIPLLDIQVLADTTICPDGEATFIATGVDGLPAYDYVWSNGDTGPTITVTTDQPATYTATVTDQCMDNASADVNVEIHDLPEVSFEADNLTGCVPQEITFTNTTPAGQVGSNCFWTINGQDIVGCDDITYEFNSPFCYDVTLTVESPEGCSNTVTYDDYICIDSDPIASFSFSPNNLTVVNNVTDLINTSVNADEYIWTIEGQGTTNEVNPTVVFDYIQQAQDVTVCLEAISEFGCTDEVCADITINDEFAIYVPNTFTPDDDDYNQNFVPQMPPSIDLIEYQLIIFNRWGEVLFESFDSSVGWNGKYGGKLVKDGTYIWQIKLIEGSSRNERFFTGHVNILR
jgi:gliding motility-associated-like protein